MFAWQRGTRKAGLVLALSAIGLISGTNAYAVSDAMSPGQPYKDSSLNARTSVIIIQTEQYNGSPCAGATYLYSRAILEGRATFSFGTVATSAWGCRTDFSNVDAAGCIDPNVDVLYHGKGNWRNQDGTNTTNVGADLTLRCGV
jgi:hypothetical protein